MTCSSHSRWSKEALAARPRGASVVLHCISGMLTCTTPHAQAAAAASPLLVHPKLGAPEAHAGLAPPTAGGSAGAQQLPASASSAQALSDSLVPSSGPAADRMPVPAAGSTAAGAGGGCGSAAGAAGGEADPEPPRGSARRPAPGTPADVQLRRLARGEGGDVGAAGCCMCMEAPCGVTLAPCGHRCTCRRAASRSPHPQFRLTL